MEPVFEKGYPSYEAVNRKEMTEDEMIIYLHDLARARQDGNLRIIADKFSEYITAAKTTRHAAIQG